MYESFYGFKEKPFDLLPDPLFYYMSSGHEEAYNHLRYAILENKGFVVITGEIGSGKTTLINFLLSKIRPGLSVGLINNTFVSPEQFVKMMCLEFELDVDGFNKSKCLQLFYDFLFDQHAADRRVTLIVDEAQNLYPKTMEEIRMLSNFEAGKYHLIQIILVGQPELRNKLQRSDLKQFAQRVSVHCHLGGLSNREVGEYIRCRLKRGGAKNGDLFDQGAIDAVCQYSRGIPRIINILCDTALLFGFSDGVKAIDRKIIEDVIAERKAGGIFSDVPPEENSASSPSTELGENSRDLKKLLLLNSNRIRRIEHILERIESGINKLADR